MHGLPETREKRKGYRKALFLGLILAGVACLAMLHAPVLAGEKNPVAGLSTAIARVARENIPAVVHIRVTQRRKVAVPPLPFENDPLFEYFFGPLGAPEGTSRGLKGLGTGTLMDGRGHILTNNHIVGGATEIQVSLSSGRTYPATLVGTDPKTDLAVIRISAKGSFPCVRFGDSDKMEVGQWVVAIGHPRDMYQTVTQGIISARHRRGIMNPTSYQDFLQTDAAINPGNSGGPLLNLHGEVVGLNTAIVSQGGGFEGLGFAIPSNISLRVAKVLIAHGRVERGWLGLRAKDLTLQQTRAFHMEERRGALIADVIKGGPAEKAGIKRGDILLFYQQMPIPDASTLRKAVVNTPIGQVVKVRVLRSGREREISVRMGNLEEASETRAASIKRHLGADVRLVTPREIERYGLESNRGVVIRWLDRNGPLASAGFEVNDVVLEINGEDIRSLEGLMALADSLAPHQRITLLGLDHRSGRTGYVQVVVP